MGTSDSIEAFIQLARKDATIQARLADCALEAWADTHLPLDINLNKVIAVAAEHGFNLSIADIIDSQCTRLAEFWQFEMENSFVARRTMSLLQYQVSGERAPLNYYEYQSLSGN